MRLLEAILILAASKKLIIHGNYVSLINMAYIAMSPTLLLLSWITKMPATNHCSTPVQKICQPKVVKLSLKCLQNCDHVNTLLKLLLYLLKGNCASDRF